MVKKLTLADIKKSNSKYTELTKVPLDDEVFVNIHKHFSPAKINELVNEMVTDGVHAEKEGIEFDKINMSDWALFNIIYKFSDLGIPSEIKKKVQAFNELVNYDYFGKIINAFPEESIIKVTEQVKLYQEKLDQMIEQRKLEIKAE